MKILLVADSSHLFLKKYLQGACAAIKDAGHEPLVLWASEELLGNDLNDVLVHDAAFRDLSDRRSPERFRKAFNVAEHLGVERIHVCFLNDSSALLESVGAVSLPAIPLSVSIFGLGAFRDSAYEAAYNRLVARRIITKTLIHSNNPAVTRNGAIAMGLLDASPVQYLYDPIYDDPGNFVHAKDAARQRLGIETGAKVVLYYGTFPHKKGADLLLEAARDCANQKISFLFAGSLSANNGFLTRKDFALANVRLDDCIIDEADTGLYFCSADLIALPYRRFYELDTSGVFVQSCLAHRPMVVPNFAPFSQTVAEFELGVTFRCEDSYDLGTRIQSFLGDTSPEKVRGFDRYLASHSTWADFTSAVINI